MGWFDRSDYVETLDGIGAHRDGKGARHEAVHPLPNLPPRAVGDGTGEIGLLRAVGRTPCAPKFRKEKTVSRPAEYAGTLTGQVALVTGASRGLGRAFAQALAGEGAAVGVTARSEAGLAETVESISSKGGRAVAVTADATDRSAASRVVAEVTQRLGPVDILVNNAGVAGPMAADWEVDPEEWWWTQEVNVLGPFLYSHAVLPDMVTRRRGRIVNISSGAATFQGSYYSAYCTSKAALSHWTNCLAGATTSHGVAVLAYHPGVVRTAMAELSATRPGPANPIADGIRQAFEEGTDTPIEDSVRMFMFLASGRADALSGRHISVEDDEGELLRRVSEIEADDLYTLRVRPLADIPQ